ncbi:MAG: carbon-nitrogen hydrolase family protein [Nitrospirae bacterium]|nr:carbon-nitrogen hydrolase family protein [Nitrospirota bacterium]
MAVVGVVQMAVADGDSARNLHHAEALIEASPGADLYLLPELFTTGYDHASWRREAARYDEVVARMGRMAKSMNVAICGSLIARDGSLLFNRMAAVGPSGAIVGYYDKIHLFAPMGETRELERGNRIALFDLCGIRFGMAICYDLRFPAMFQMMASDGVHAVLVSSEWPYARRAAMDTLCRARAIENQCFFALSNRAGSACDGTEFLGGSMIVDPVGGAICLPEGGDEGVFMAEFMRETVELSRSAINAIADRMAGVDYV